MSEIVFVGMPFGDERDPAFKGRCDAVFAAIEAVCEALDLEACRVDQYAGSHGITAQIKALIREADYCIFDLTGERPNVYYEVGYAHGDGHTGDTIIFIADKGTKLHFDLAHRAVRFFGDAEELRAMLAEDLEVMVEDEDEAD